MEKPRLLSESRAARSQFPGWMSANDDIDVASDARIDNATKRAVIPMLELVSQSSCRGPRWQLQGDARLPAVAGCAILQRLAARRDCADRNDRGKSPLSRKATDAPEFRHARKF